MSQLPLPRAQKYFPSRAPSDIVQWRDNKNQTQAWFNSLGIFHYLGDGSGSNPTHDAVTIISTGVYVGSAPNNPNFMILWDSARQNVVGWISGAGIPGGSLASLTNGNPIGWIDSTGTPSGNGPII